MDKLNASYLSTTQLNRSVKLALPRNRAAKLPERIIQFGEGTFLRGFVDDLINQANGKGIFAGRIVMVQPSERGCIDELRTQDNMYTLLLRSTENGETVEQRSLITSISRSLKAHSEWDEVLLCAENPDIDIMISDTSETEYENGENDIRTMSPPVSFPAKLTAYLHHRWLFFKGDPSKGMLILPVEQIEQNAASLKKHIQALCTRWGLPGAFVNWLKDNNTFCNSIVDRIIPGFPIGEAVQLCEELGYEDNLLTVGEPFSLWSIDGNESAASRFPLHELANGVTYTSNYETDFIQKVRVLNGSHSALAPLAFLLGVKTVREMTDHTDLDEFFKTLLFNEIIHSLPYGEDEMENFAFKVIERFKNQAINHEWSKILVNATAKIKTRLLPSIITYIQNEEKLPEFLVFAFAAYLRYAYVFRSDATGYYAPDDHDDEYRIEDASETLKTLLTYWEEADPADMETVKVAVVKVLKNEALWGSDLTTLAGFSESVQESFTQLIEHGTETTFKKFLTTHLA